MPSRNKIFEENNHIEDNSSKITLISYINMSHFAILIKSAIYMHSYVLSYIVFLIIHNVKIAIIYSIILKNLKKVIKVHQKYAFYIGEI